MNKYQLFFSSFKAFVIQIKLSKLDDLCGIKDSEISSFEATYNIKIPKSVISFFQIMGKKMNIRNNQYGIFTISEFIKGMEVSNKLNLSKYINKSENSNKYVYFSIDRIQEDYIYFFDSQEENPKVFLQWDLMDDEDYQDCYGKNPPPRKIDCIGSFITLFREFLYQLIFIELEYSKDEYQDRLFADLDKIEWTKYYQNLFKDNVIESHAFRKYRRRFYEIIESIEEKEDKILTIDEFEWAFIDYLKEKGYTL